MALVPKDALSDTFEAGMAARPSAGAAGDGTEGLSLEVQQAAARFSILASQAPAALHQAMMAHCVECMWALKSAGRLDKPEDRVEALRCLQMQALQFLSSRLQGATAPGPAWWHSLAAAPPARRMRRVRTLYIPLTLHMWLSPAGKHLVQLSRLCKGRAVPAGAAGAPSIAELMSMARIVWVLMCPVGDELDYMKEHPPPGAKRSISETHNLFVDVQRGFELVLRKETLDEFRVVVARLPDTSIRDYPTEMGLCVGRLQEEVQQQEADEPSEGGPSQVLTLHMDEAGVAGKVEDAGAHALDFTQGERQLLFNKEGGSLASMLLSLSAAKHEDKFGDLLPTLPVGHSWAELQTAEGAAATAAAEGATAATAAQTAATRAAAAATAVAAAHRAVNIAAAAEPAVAALITAATQAATAAVAAAVDAPTEEAAKAALGAAWGAAEGAAAAAVATEAGDAAIKMAAAIAAAVGAANKAAAAAAAAAPAAASHAVRAAATAATADTAAAAAAATVAPAAVIGPAAAAAASAADAAAAKAAAAKAAAAAVAAALQVAAAMAAGPAPGPAHVAAAPAAGGTVPAGAGVAAGAAAAGAGAGAAAVVVEAGAAAVAADAGAGDEPAPAEEDAVEAAGVAADAVAEEAAAAAAAAPPPPPPPAAAGGGGGLVGRKRRRDPADDGEED